MIRTIQKLLNKDRTVCDFINAMDGWKINPTDKDGLRILIDPIYMPIYALYITYNNDMPAKEELKILYKALTDKNSIVQKAHSLDMPLEQYVKTYLIKK